jgi:hypothetical protein
LNKTFVIILIFFLILIGCNRKQHKVDKIQKAKIEIYLPKERIVSKDGSELLNDWNFRKELKKYSSSILLNDYHLKYARYDSITHNIIYAGSFSATENDLPSTPFIYDNEILGFDFETSEIIISASGVEKLWSLQPNMNFSRQFILTADRKPILTGYFYSIYSSSYVKHFYIVYNSGYEGVEKPEFKDENFKIEYNPESEFNWELEKYDFKKSDEFYDAFEKSGKIAK